jgi:hypothetical protein
LFTPTSGTVGFNQSFTMPSPATSISVIVYASVAGSPGPLVVTIKDSGGNTMGSGSIAASSIEGVGWTAPIPITLTKSLAAGAVYTASFTATGSSPANYYNIWINDATLNWWDVNAIANYSIVQYSIGNTGSSILRVLDQTGSEVVTLPLTSWNTGPGKSLLFTADSAFSFKTLSPWLSDMHQTLPGYQGSFAVTDVTTGQLLATATASQLVNSHGQMGLLPFTLNNTVTTVPGHQYQITLNEPGYAYGVLFRGNNVSPSAVGFQGQALSSWYQLVGTQLVVGHVDYAGPLGAGGEDSITSLQQAAVRFSPTQNGTLTEVQWEVWNNSPTGQFYPSGHPLTVSIYSDNPASTTGPLGVAPKASLASVNIDSGAIPQQGYLGAKGFSLPVVAGTNYWIVLSTTSSALSVPLMRLVSPFRFYCLKRNNSGAWNYCDEGPTDWAFKVFTTAETLGNPVVQGLNLPVTTTNYVAQPFVAPSNGTVNCVWLSGVSSSTTVSVYGDNGSGAPNMNQLVAQGTYGSPYVYFYSAHYVPVSGSNPVLQAGTKYWVVISSASGAAAPVPATYYWSRYGAQGIDQGTPAGFDTLISSDSGKSWKPAYSGPCEIIFQVGYSIGQTGQYTSSTKSSSSISASCNAITASTAVGSTTTSTSTTASSTSGGLVPAYTYNQILLAHGMTTCGLVAFGEPFKSGAAPFASLQAAVNYYSSVAGFGVYPWQDGSDGYTSDLAAQLADWQSVGGVVLGPLDGWGYNTGFLFKAATLYPNEQEYYYSKGVFTAASNYGMNGVVIDAPEYLQLWVQLYSQIDQEVGLKNLAGIAGWIQSDHGVNYGGAEGANGGHNMNSYVRYVNSPLGFYLRDTTQAGIHSSDGSPCTLWSLRGQSANYAGHTTVSVDSKGAEIPGTGIIPTVQMANDISTYHRAGGQLSSFESYMATANAAIEAACLSSILQRTPYAFARTAIPVADVANIPSYYNSVLETMASSTGTAFAGLQASGGGQLCIPYFNFCNAGDNSSNPGSSGMVGVATASTVLQFWNSIVPFFSTYPIMEADTAVSLMQAQTANTAWGHFGSLYRTIPIGSWHGYAQDKIQLLSIDHYYGNPNTYSALGLVCHQWGVDSELPLQTQVQSLTGLANPSLGSFSVVFGIPNSASDMNLLRSYVSNGGNLLVYSGSGAPSDLTGMGTTAVPIPYGHPITLPYAKADLDAAMPKGHGTINQYGKGKVVTLTSSYYGEGIGCSNENSGGGCDGLASGLGYLTLNAILWLGGLTPPAVYLPKYVKRTSWAVALSSNGEGDFSGIGIHLNCSATNPGQKRLMISNATSNTPKFQVNLSSAFYDYSSSWSMKDYNSKQVIQGTGDPSVNQNLPANDWVVYVSQ